MNAPAEDAVRLLDRLQSMPPDEQLAHFLGIGATAETLGRLAVAATHQLAAGADRGLEATATVLSLADRFDDPEARIQARRARARAFAYAGRYEEAIAVCDEAAAIAETDGLPVEGARATLASMHALTELGRLDAAIASGRKARQAFIDCREPALAARADINLGIAYQRRDEPDLAVECFDRARAPLHDDPLILGHIDNNRAEALLALNDFAGARHGFEAALRAYEHADSHVTAAIAEGNLADLAARRGHLREAMEHFERARRRFEVHDSPVHLARLLAEQAEAKAILGLPGEALAEYEAVLPQLDSLSLALEAARARAGMGLVLIRLERHTDAETALAAAALAFDELGNGTARAKVDVIRSELLVRRGRLVEARRLALRSISALVDRPADLVVARHVLVKIAMAVGDAVIAESELNMALDVARRLDLPPLIGDLLHTAGLLAGQRGDAATAVETLTNAVAAVERVRGTLQADRLRAAYLGDRSEIYEHLIEATLALGDDDAIGSAFAVAEQAKSRTLLDQIGFVLDGGLEGPDDTDDADDPKASSLAKQLQISQAVLNALYSRLADAHKRDQRNGRLAELQRRIHEQERTLDALQTRLSVTSGAAGLLASTTTLSETQTRLGPGDTLVEYMTAGDTLLAFVVDAGQATIHRLGRLADVTPSLSRLRFQIDRALRPGAETSRRFERMVADTRDELAALHASLLEPIADRLDGADTLSVVPHGPLHLVPFHALWDGTRYLIERFAVHTAPSASILAQLSSGASRRGPGSGGALVVGVADAVAPRIGDEARMVSRALRCDDDSVLVDNRATAETVLRLAPHAGILHLACHGAFSPESPASSGLRLADRWLTVRDISSMRLDADLVTLSGCETGVNVVHAGDELMGLLRGFFAAGARSLIVSLWHAHDESACELMCDFYDDWRGGGDSGKAALLQSVLRRAMERHPHPAHWAPFVLVGES